MSFRRRFEVTLATSIRRRFVESKRRRECDVTHATKFWTWILKLVIESFMPCTLWNTTPHLYLKTWRRIDVANVTSKPRRESDLILAMSAISLNFDIYGLYVIKTHKSFLVFNRDVETASRLDVETTSHFGRFGHENWIGNDLNSGLNANFIFDVPLCSSIKWAFFTHDKKLLSHA